ncbi:uncharacterized protein BHQ10_007338 [Talaromyces amestolkiae]|uniref:Uncharacterized protein n=1 Tax=Talaromyces amestolkiae TaxID=1196081 RepID=A0A364L6A6_TALAM|nr:uncharacterized protein BHQ10_007338 [Talaromyces amestolkiae]RAO71326.1 hypothetical protein BHQ10_007338 [Talaromyces amestolkiae]
MSNHSLLLQVPPSFLVHLVYLVSLNLACNQTSLNTMLFSQIRQRAQAVLYDPLGPHGHAVPYTQAYHQTVSWVAAQQSQYQPHLQIAPPTQPFAVPRPLSPPIAGLCISCIENVESVGRLQQSQPNYGLTEEEVMGTETWHFVVESYQKAQRLVNNWIEFMSALNPFNTRFASVDFPSFPFHLALPPYSSPPDISIEPIVEEVYREMMMRKVHTMILKTNAEIQAIENRFAVEGSAYYENNPNRFVSHASAHDPFTVEPLGDVPEVIHPLLRNRPQSENYVMPKSKVSRAVRNSIDIRDAQNRSPTPASRSMHESSLLDANMATSMDIDEAIETGRFAVTGDTTDDDAEGETEDDCDTLVYPSSITDRSPMAMSGTPALTIDNTPSRATVNSIATPTTAPRSRKRQRVVDPLPERWRSALRPRQHMREESMDGLYLD